jgi:hypothetical protein
MKTQNEVEMRQSFLRAYQEDFLKDLIRLTKTVYLSAYEECKKNYPLEEAHDLRGHIRRAKLEVQLRELGKRYSNVYTNVQTNKKKTSYFTTLQAENVVITANQVAHPKIMVRSAMFRNTLARSSQIELYDEQIEIPPVDASLYAILLHGEDATNPKRPGFAQIVFPNSDCTKYLAQINLFAKYNVLVSELWSVKEEIVKPKLDIKLSDEALKKLQQNKKKKVG